VASAQRTALRRVAVGSVALLDNTVNISYVTAKLLRRAGVDVAFVQQGGAPFNQQPVWEDEDIVETTENGSPAPRSGYWERRETKLGWQRPDWVVRPSLGVGALAAFPAAARRVARAVPVPLVPFGLAIAAKELAVVAAASRRDFIVALGPAAAQAYLTGRRYAVVVTGWDVRELPFLTGARSPLLRARAWLQRAALAHAETLLVQPASDLPHLRRLGLADRARPFNIPVDLEGYAAITPGPSIEVFGAAIARKARGKVLFFAPARVDFAIKRTDVLVEAFAAVARRAPAHLVVLEWGPDVPRARSMVRDLGLEQDVSFLPCVMSKVRLVRALKLADVIADQFLYTAYGSLTREVLACGRPLVSSYDPAEPQPHDPDDPAPILSARTVAEVADACVALLDPAERERRGRAAREWTARQNASSMATLGAVLGRTA